MLEMIAWLESFSLTDVFIYFWVVPFAVTAAGVVAWSEYLDRKLNRQSRFTPRDAAFFLLITAVYPLGVVVVLGGMVEYWTDPTSFGRTNQTHRDL